jgi:hypothetical protein
MSPSPPPSPRRYGCRDSEAHSFSECHCEHPPDQSHDDFQANLIDRPVSGADSRAACQSRTAAVGCTVISDESVSLSTRPLSTGTITVGQCASLRQ